MNEIINKMIKTKVPENGVALWYLGQESMVVKGSKCTCYFDPYLTDSIHETYGDNIRNYESPVAPEDVTNADYIFISHNHGDHLDTKTLIQIKKSSPNSIFICPFPNIDILQNIGIDNSRIIGAKAGEVIKLKDILVTPIAEKHEDFQVDEQGNHYFLGYVVQIDNITFYHAGDTIGFKALADELKPYNIDVACMPINGRDWKRYSNNLIGNMNGIEAVELCNAIGADMLIPMHYDLFEKNTENPAYFLDYLYKKYPRQKFKMFTLAERMFYVKEE